MPEQTVTFRSALSVPGATTVVDKPGQENIAKLMKIPSSALAHSGPLPRPDVKDLDADRWLLPGEIVRRDCFQRRQVGEAEFGVNRA
jgi:hypothetical protein